MSTQNKISFPTHAQVSILDENRVLLWDQEDAHILTGASYVLLAPYLNGSYHEDDIVARLAEQHPPAELYYAIERLRSRGHLVEVTDLPSTETAFWHARGTAVTQVNARRAERQLVLQFHGEVPAAAELEAMLAANGLRLGNDDQADLRVVVATHYLELGHQPALFDHLVPWLPVRLTPTRAWVGPVLDSEAEIQWHYLLRRLQQNLTADLMHNRPSSQRLWPPQEPGLPSCEGLAARFAATEITKLVLQAETLQVQNEVLTLDAASGEIRRHPLPDRELLLELAQQSAGDGAVTLASRRKRFVSDGGFRCRRPDQTLARVVPFISPMTGIIPDIRELDDHSGIHVFSTRQPIAGTAMGAAGKGVTMVQAKVSCCAEAIERYCGVFRGDEPRTTASLAELGDSAVHPSTLLQYSATQYAQRERWNEQHQGANRIPAPFDEQAEIEWTPVWSLTRGTRRWLPTAFCYYDYPLPKDRKFCSGDSNGCAAGNNLEEALLQGLLELIERDATAIWWYNRIRRPGIDLPALRDRFVQQVLEYNSDLGRDVTALDLTSDLGVPVAAAVSWHRGTGDRIHFALGAHLNLRLAVMRALSELNQFSAHQAEGEISPYFAKNEHELWKQSATLENQPYVVPLPGTQTPPDAHTYPGGDDLRDDLQWLIDRIQRRHIEVLMLDQTREDSPLSVVRVVTPGLRHFWARFGPGRLYEVPVAQGWLAEPTAEADLNPIPVFI